MVDAPGSILQALERFLLPNACVACQRWVGEREPDALVCGRCRLRLRPLLGGCERCRQPLPPVGSCRFCAGWPPELAWTRSAVWLDQEAREMVHHLKYAGLGRLAGLMGAVIARTVARPPAGTLVPIPIARGRLRERGYNQAALLARALSLAWQLPVREELLTRRREGGSQTALTPQARAVNVAGAFGARPPGSDPAAPPDPAAGAAGGAGTARGTTAAAAPAGGAAPDRVVIVDDVLTTGATLAAAAGALAEAGWGHIGAITFARALPFERRVT